MSQFVYFNFQIVHDRGYATELCQRASALRDRVIEANARLAVAIEAVEEELLVEAVTKADELGMGLVTE